MVVGDMWIALVSCKCPVQVSQIQRPLRTVSCAFSVNRFHISCQFLCDTVSMKRRESLRKGNSMAVNRQPLAFHHYDLHPMASVPLKFVAFPLVQEMACRHLRKVQCGRALVESRGGRHSRAPCSTEGHAIQEIPAGKVQPPEGRVGPAWNLG